MGSCNTSPSITHPDIKPNSWWADCIVGNSIHVTSELLSCFK